MRRSRSGGPREVLGFKGVTAKDTFLNIAAEEPLSPLRVVHTAAGRLDLMVRE